MTSPYIASEAERLGIKTEYVPSHYRFQREQSRTLKEMEWESRADALEPAWLAWLNAGCWLLFAYSIFKVLPVLAAIVSMH